MPSSNKKSRRGENPKVLRHVGLLFNSPPETNRVAIYLVIRFVKEGMESSIHFPAQPHCITRRETNKEHIDLIFGVVYYGGASRVRDRDWPPWKQGSTRGKKILRTTAMKTRGEIEATICQGITQFEQEYMGRGPKHIHAHLIGDLLVVRLEGVLTAAEQQLVKTLPPEKGRDLLKQVRTQLIETARPVLEGLVKKITEVDVVSLHHDISVVTGEEVVLFTLAEPPPFRETGKR